jgi:tryptophanyl-tRNA synthetase
MKRVYSGIRATGRLHLGNYFGAVKGMLALQDTHDCVFSVVDLHTITVPYDPETLQTDVRNIVLDYLAVGLDPKKCKLEIQSKIPEHTELAYLLSTIYPVAHLEDLPTYKDKKAQYPKYVNMGLLYYPVLMAADILLYKGELVPVGVDQEPHLEVAREIVRKFNSMFGQIFPEPQRFKTDGEYIPSLLGEGKMSKSVEGSYINLVDDFETIKKKVRSIPTADVSGGKMSAGVEVLFKLLELFDPNSVQNFKKEYDSGKLQFVTLKDHLSDKIFEHLKPIQERRKEFESNPGLVDSIINEGIEECQKIAHETMQEVRKKMGLSA